MKNDLYEIKDWVCLCLGMCDSEAGFIDKLYEDFECNCFDDCETMQGVISECYFDLKNHIIDYIYDDVINRAKKIYNIDENDFSVDINGICSTIKYKDEPLESYRQLVKIIEKEQ